MDPELLDAYEFGKVTRTIQNQRDLIKSKTKSKLHYSKNGSLFYINPELILFVKMNLELGKNELILLDKNENLSKVENLQEFYDDIVGRYHEVLNEMYYEYEKVSKVRDLKES